MSALTVAVAAARLLRYQYRDLPHVPVRTQGTRLGYCFNYWRKFAARNRKMRAAWVSAAAVQIEEALRYSVNALKANWQYARYRRRIITTVFR
jgi:hypothetical protein